MAAEVEEKSFRQLEDAGCPSDILTMKWSPKMDLIAIITADGDVWLNRLSWQRVWTKQASENVKAVSLAWRPDGKALALGLDNGKIQIVNVENNECLHEYVVGSKPETLEWVETRAPKSSNLPENVRIFDETDETFLPQLPSLPSGGSTVFSQEKSSDAPWDPKRLKTLSGTLSFLVVGDQNCMVTLLVHGMLPVSRVSVRGQVSDGAAAHSRILSVSLDANLRSLVVVMETSTSSDFADGTVTMVTFDTTLLRSRSHELEVLALKYGRISSLLTYFDGTFQAMSEAWEDILLEVDSRLDKYAQSLGPDTSVPEEFLMLFTCGTLTPELQAFLVYDLTDKGLKKLGKTVESSYSNIQTLALKNLQSVSNALLYHLNDLYGMAKWYERFGILGLSEPLVTECLSVLGSLMLKTQELCSVIGGALRSFTAFFKWLYYVILQILEDDVPPFVKQFNQEDVDLIATFLHCHLARDGDAVRAQNKGQTRFSMERVGQYLEKEPLTFQIDHSGNVWENLLDTCPELRDLPFIIPVCPEKSLATLHDELATRIQATFDKLTDQMLLSCQLRVPLCTRDNVSMVTQYSVAGKDEHHWIALSQGGSGFHLLRLRNEDATIGNVVAEGMSVDLAEIPGEGQSGSHVIDLAFYDQKTLTILLRRNPDAEVTTDTLAQLSLPSLAESMFQPLASLQGEVCPFLDRCRADGSDAVLQRRDLARMKASRVTVSGSRKVACVLSTSRTRVKLFDMDADEDADQSLDESHSTSIMSSDSGI